MGYILVFFLGTYLILRVQPAKLSMSKMQTNQPDDLAAELETPRPRTSSRVIGITLEDFSLTIHKRSLISRKTPGVSILKPINATFKPGILNVIMGPSSLGKTLLTPYLFTFTNKANLYIARC